MNLFINDRTGRDHTVIRRPFARISTASSFFLAALFAISGSNNAFAQWFGGGGGNDAGILVEGSADVKTVPDIVEINLRLSAKGELTDDAVVKHRDSRKRTLETFKALKIENLDLQERSLALKAGTNMQEMMWGGMPPSGNKRTQVEVGSTLRARLTGIDKMPPEELMSTVGKLLDAAQDSGVGLGMSDSDMMMMWRYGWGGRMNNSLVKFVVSNTKEQREKAYELAVADARKRAERLARLNNVKLANVLSVDEYSSNFNNRYYYPQFDSDEEDSKEEIVADSLTGGRLRVSVRVRFAIEPIKKENTEQAAVDPKK